MIKTRDVINLLILTLILGNALFNKYFTVLPLYTRIFVAILFIGILISILSQVKLKKDIIDAVLLLFLFVLYLLFIGVIRPEINQANFGMILTITIMIISSNVYLNGYFYKILTITSMTMFLLQFAESFSYMYRNDSHNFNTLALRLLVYAMYSVALMKKFNVKHKKLVSLLIVICAAIGIIQVKSRASLIGIAAFIVFEYIIPKKFWQNKKTVLFTLTAIIITSFLLTYISVKLYESNIFYNISLFTGKTTQGGTTGFAGREIVWKFFYDEIKVNRSSLLFGFTWDQKLNLHNNNLGMITRCGIIGFIIYYFFIFKMLNMLYIKKVSDTQISFVIIYFAYLIHQFAEQMDFSLISCLCHLALGAALTMTSEFSDNINKKIKEILWGKVK